VNESPIEKPVVVLDAVAMLVYVFVGPATLPGGGLLNPAAAPSDAL